MQNDVIVVVVNGSPLSMSIFDCKTLADVGRDARAAMRYDAGEWEFRSPAGDLLPASMPVRELVIGDDTQPDLYLSLRTGVGA